MQFSARYLDLAVMMPVRLLPLEDCVLGRYTIQVLDAYRKALSFLHCPGCRLFRNSCAAWRIFLLFTERFWNF